MKFSRATLVGQHECPRRRWSIRPACSVSMRVVDHARVADGRRRQRNAARARIDDDREPVVVAQRVDEHPQRGLDQRQPFGRRHRSGDVDQQHDVAAGDVAAVDGLRAQRRSSTSLCAGAHGQSPTSVVIETGRPPRGSGYGEPEVVDELFDAHGVGRRQLAVRKEAPHVRVRRGVHIGGKRRQGLGCRALEAIRLDARVGFRIGVGLPLPGVETVAAALAGSTAACPDAVNRNAHLRLRKAGDSRRRRCGCTGNGSGGGLNHFGPAANFHGFCKSADLERHREPIRSAWTDAERRHPRLEPGEDRLDRVPRLITMAFRSPVCPSDRSASSVR